MRYDPYKGLLGQFNDPYANRQPVQLVQNPFELNMQAPRFIEPQRVVEMSQFGQPFDKNAAAGMKAAFDAYKNREQAPQQPTFDASQNYLNAPADYRQNEVTAGNRGYALMPTPANQTYQAQMPTGVNMGQGNQQDDERKNRNLILGIQTYGRSI